MPSDYVLSVVIPVHNNADTLGVQLEALLSTSDEKTEIIVVDNMSTDGSREVAQACGRGIRRMRVLDAPDRPLEAYARNVGARAAASECLAFCDGDDEVDASWCAAMARALSEHDYVTGPIDVVKLNPTWLQSLRGTAIFESIPTTIGRIPFAHGANIGLRREALERMGWFDETVPTATDVHLGLQAARAGVVLSWCPEALVHYRLRTGVRERWRQGLQYGRAARDLRARLPGVVTRRQLLSQRARRALWLGRTAPGLVSRSGRARWLWNVSILAGDLGLTRGR